MIIPISSSSTELVEGHAYSAREFLKIVRELASRQTFNYRPRYSESVPAINPNGNNRNDGCCRVPHYLARRTMNRRALCLTKRCQSMLHRTKRQLRSQRPPQSRRPPRSCHQCRLWCHRQWWLKPIRQRNHSKRGAGEAVLPRRNCCRPEWLAWVAPVVSLLVIFGFFTMLWILLHPQPQPTTATATDVAAKTTAADAEKVATAADADKLASDKEVG